MSAKHIPQSQSPPIAPECDKMLAVRAESQAIGSFLDWLTTEKRIELSTIDENGRLQSFRYTVERLLAEYFEIDLNKVEAEKRTILASIAP